MNLTEIPEFRTGLVAGVVVAVVLVVWSGLFDTRKTRRPLPFGGLAFAVAALWSVGRDRPTMAVLIGATAGLAAVSALSSLPKFPVWASFILTIPFAWAIGFHTGVPDVLWVRLLVVVVASGGGTLVGMMDVVWQEEAPSLALFALTVGGMYFAVPDTEEAAALLGVALPLALLGWPVAAARLGRGGAAAATGVFVWAAAVDGRGRLPSIVGSVACLGLLVGIPLGRALLPPRGPAHGRVPRTVVLGLMGIAQLALVFVASRVAGLRTDLSAAVAVAVFVGTVAILVGAAFRSADPASRPE